MELKASLALSLPASSRLLRKSGHVGDAFRCCSGPVDGIRSVLCLFEGVATGADDGYARMTDKPAATLLHLGRWPANGSANLHNAKRARSPVCSTSSEEHAQLLDSEFDAPLTSDIEALAQPFSGWLRTSLDSGTIAADGADAIAAHERHTWPDFDPDFLPAGYGLGPRRRHRADPQEFARAKVEEERIAAAAEVLRTGLRL